jgi:hypothetical protein
MNEASLGRNYNQAAEGRREVSMHVLGKTISGKAWWRYNIKSLSIKY